MLLQNCFYCHQSLAEDLCLCKICYEIFLSQKNLKITYRGTAADILKITSVFSYGSKIRDLMLLAKVSKNLFANKLIVKLFLREALFDKGEFDYVIPAASSLFSRFKGNSDVAFNLAESLSLRTEAKLLPAPLCFGWSLRKQTKKTITQRKKHRELLKTSQLTGRILLVDDVTTSGSTLVSLADFFPLAEEISAVTFAAAG